MNRIELDAENEVKRILELANEIGVILNDKTLSPEKKYEMVDGKTRMMRNHTYALSEYALEFTRREVA